MFILTMKHYYTALLLYNIYKFLFPLQMMICSSLYKIGTQGTKSCATRHKYYKTCFPRNI
ncbi:hypothetical protein Hanom_Chr08g00739821 [Helianthus anomalus]